MNKQEVERALNWAKAFQEHEEYARDTYEDTCGSGDMTNEERKEMYEAMESSINLFKTIASALQQQLTGGWIPVSSGIYPEDISQRVLATLKNEMVLEVWYTCNEFKFLECIPGGGLKKVNEFNPVVAWMPLPESWKEPIQAPTIDSADQN